MAAAAAAAVAVAAAAAPYISGTCEPPREPFIVLLAEPVPATAAPGETCVEVHDKMPGHRAVTPGAIAALQAARAKFWFNPTCAWERADAVWVLNPGNGGDQPPDILNALRPRAGLLYAGPNALAFKFGSRPVDAWVVPHRGIGDSIDVLTGGRLPFFAWPVGIDTARWAPTVPRAARLASALLYIKTEPPAELLAAVRDALKAAKVTAVTEVRYGSYDLEGYRAALLGAGALVVFTTSESQGAFYFEAWAADVPTFVFSGVGGFQHEWDGNIWLTEPAPYLSPLTGAYWSTPAQLANLFRPALQFQPRRWVMEHGSLEVVGAALVSDVRARLQAKCQRESEPQPPQTP